MPESLTPQQCVASCHIRVSFLLAPSSLCRLVFAFLFNYHRKDIKRSFISLLRLWQAKEMRSEKWVSSACRCRNEAAFPFLTSLRRSRRVLKSMLLPQVDGLLRTVRTAAAAHHGKLKRSNGDRAKFCHSSVPCSLIIKFRKFLTPLRELESSLTCKKSKFCLNSPIK